jgi:hypothetical protein
VSDSSTEDPLGMARRHVADGEGRVARQEAPCRQVGSRWACRARRQSKDAARHASKISRIVTRGSIADRERVQTIRGLRVRSEKPGLANGLPSPGDGKARANQPQPRYRRKEEEPRQKRGWKFVRATTSDTGKAKSTMLWAV